MIRKLSMAGMAVALIALLAVPASATAPPVQLSAKLKGANEVPGPGDPNGKGEIFMTVNKKRHKICFALTFKKIQDPVAGHIHRGAADVAGPVKVELFSDPAGLPGPSAEGCVKNLKRRFLRRLSNHADRFYVNLHNGDYPDGAIRGQLVEAL